MKTCSEAPTQLWLPIFHANKIRVQSQNDQTKFLHVTVMSTARQIIVGPVTKDAINFQWLPQFQELTIPKISNIIQNSVCTATYQQPVILKNEVTLNNKSNAEVKQEFAQCVEDFRTQQLTKDF